MWIQKFLDTRTLALIARMLTRHILSITAQLIFYNWPFRQAIIAHVAVAKSKIAHAEISYI